MFRRPPISTRTATPFPYTRSADLVRPGAQEAGELVVAAGGERGGEHVGPHRTHTTTAGRWVSWTQCHGTGDRRCCQYVRELEGNACLARKSTRLNSRH